MHLPRREWGIVGRNGERVGDSGEERERVGDSGEERERVGIVGKKGREWGIVGKKGERVGDSWEKWGEGEWRIIIACSNSTCTDSTPAT